MNKKLLFLLPATALLLVGCGKSDTPTTTPTGGGDSGSVTPTPTEPVHAGTEADPFDAADAALVASKLEESGSDVTHPSDKAYFVKGEVVALKEDFNPSYGNFHFQIGQGASEFIGYRLKNGADQKNFTSADDLVVGDTVTMYGHIINFHNTYEISATKASTNTVGYIVSIAKPVTSVTLDQEAIGVVKGTTATLTATVLPDSAISKSVVWSVKDANPAGCVTVEDGVVSGVELGTAKVVATSAVDETKFAECAVTVTESGVLPTSVELDKTTSTLNAGESETLSVTVLPSEATNKSVTWSVVDADPEGCLTVDENGVVTAGEDVDSGTAKVVATSVSNPSLSDTCTYTIDHIHGTIASDPLTLAEAYEEGDKLESGETTERAYYSSGFVTKIDSAYSTQYGNVTVWLSDEVGTAFELFRIPVTEELGVTITLGSVITFKSQITKYNTTIETVQNAGKIISVDNSAYTLVKVEGEESVEIGNSINLTATAYPELPTTPTFNWSSSDETIAEVSSEGVVTGKSAGEVTITAETSGVEGTFSITVLESGSAKATLKSVVTANTTAKALTESGTLTSALNLDTEVFTVTYDVNGASSELAVRTDGIRMYATKQSTNGNKLTVSIATGYVIESIEIAFDSGYSSTAQILVGSTVVAENEGSYAINSSAFTIFNNNSSVSSNTQVRFQTITINYSVSE